LRESPFGVVEGLSDARGDPLRYLPVKEGAANNKGHSAATECSLLFVASRAAGLCGYMAGITSGRSCESSSGPAR
jgi:hypothetical protein